MKNYYFLFLLSFITCVVNAQGREDFIADTKPNFGSSNSRNLVLFISSEKISSATESIGNSGGTGSAAAIKYFGLQYLYLQNHTVFLGPISRRSPVEIISSTPNKLVFRLPKIRDNVLEVDLASVHESANQIGVQVATISYQ